MNSEKFCYVYFGIAKDRSGFKVGVSQNPVKRASSFATEIELEDSMQFRCKRSDALRMEKTIHFLFGKHRLAKDKADGYTEWFDFAALDEVRGFVVTNKDKFNWLSFEPMRKTHGLPQLMFWLDSYRQGFLKLSKDRGIAENLGLTMPSVSRAIKLLCDKQIVLKKEKAGRKLSYRLNLEYAKVG